MATQQSMIFQGALNTKVSLANTEVSYHEQTRTKNYIPERLLGM